MKNSKLELLLVEQEKKTPFQCDKDMIMAIEKIIKKERRKRESKQDFDLITECCEILLELRGYDLNELEKSAERSKKRILDNVHEMARSEAKTSLSKSKPFFKRRKLVSVIVSVAMFFTITGTAIVGFGFGPLEYIRFLINSSNEDYDDNITHLNGEKVKYYKSIEELCEKEQLHILFPSYLPKGVTLDKIGMSSENIDDFQIIFEFSADTLVFNVYNYSLNDFTAIHEQIQPYISGDISYYIFDEGIDCYVYYEYNNIQYTIKYNDYSELIKIINSIEEHR